ncbi:ribose-phosphate pyrophosphokinase-like domain-containing protein, partial [Candidatus Pelagibacter bacterium]
KFSDGEIYIEINENIRGNSIFIIQSISSPANDNLMELLLCIDALKKIFSKKYYCCYSLFWICTTRSKSSA